MLTFSQFEMSLLELYFQSSVVSSLKLLHVPMCFLLVLESILLFVHLLSYLMWLLLPMNKLPLNLMLMSFLSWIDQRSQLLMSQLLFEREWLNLWKTSVLILISMM